MRGKKVEWNPDTHKTPSLLPNMINPPPLPAREGVITMWSPWTTVPRRRRCRARSVHHAAGEERCSRQPGSPSSHQSISWSAHSIVKDRKTRRGVKRGERARDSHQTPLNSEKYASWYRFCADSTASGGPYPGSGQKPAGMHGNGLRQTSSPASSGPATVPVGVKASTAIPRSRHWISPRNTGSAVHIPAKSEQMSVPPASEW